MDDRYELKLDYHQISLLRFITEVTLNRLLNYLAHNQELINELEAKIANNEYDIKKGKKGFLINPQEKLTQRNQKLKQLLSIRREPESDLRTARSLYEKILDSEEAVSPGHKEMFKKEKYFEDREHILLYGGYKDYFKIEHHIY